MEGFLQRNAEECDRPHSADRLTFVRLFASSPAPSALRFLLSSIIDHYV